MARKKSPTSYGSGVEYQHLFFWQLGFGLFLLHYCSILKLLDGCDRAEGLMRPTQSQLTPKLKISETNICIRYLSYIFEERDGCDVVGCKHMAGCPWCGGNFLTNHHLSNFPSPRHWGAALLWQSSDEAQLPPKPKPLDIFSKKQHIRRLTFSFVRDSDLFAPKLWICSVWPKLYFSDIVVCICVCCSHPWFIVHLFLELSNALWKPLIWCPTLQRSHWLTWCGCVVATALLLMRICELWHDVDFLPVSVAMTWTS